MLKKIKQPAKQYSPEKTKFSEKWAEIEKKQKRNTAFQKKIAILYSSFQSEILPAEEQMCELLAEEARHLISFMARKSFTQWQREELLAWIESNIETLKNHPFCPEGLSAVLDEEYHEALFGVEKEIDEDDQFDAEKIQEMRALIDEMFACGDDFSDAELIDFLRDPALFHQHFSSFLKEDKKESEADSFQEEFDHSEHFQGYTDSQDKQHKKLTDLFNASQLKKCYKMLASRLHPDKEQDPLLKAQKSELMGQLVQAKKDQDAFTIITMFQEYVPNNDLNLDDDVTAELLILLSEKSARIDREYRELQYPDSIESMIWQKLGGRSKKIIETKKEEHLKALLASQSSLKNTITTTRTMKPLNKILSDRYDMRHASPFANCGSLEALLNGHFDI
ncbi:conserved hypothetical DnaJ domain protein [Psychromonas ingrahamii 37]|uniref:Conserved hypothetical DnaJ domain protein n=1 Tax=Psychromonas ingrahamii (strain DSM 17664 / CCUG 51855 / 37) TaxID=357804 RepID=A1SXZ0_PSYIN|nr:hypothetical protein [Psychromonas ingrahamii]ABM04355.1 conserved hypothetical DnaJ domain protein [Psychromonas ingrahamii 37]